MTVDQAQALSHFALGLFVVTLLVILVGTLLRLGPKVLHWAAIIGFSACLLMGAITSMLYIWHHYLRH